MRRQLLPALTTLLVFTVITGIVYPLAVTGVGQLFFGDQANGALLERDGQVIGSAHIGQQFTAAKYFHPRPSSAGDGYDAAASSGSNLGPTNEKLLAAVAERVTAYRKETICRPIRWFRSTRLPARVPGWTRPYRWSMPSCRHRGWRRRAISR